MHAHAISLFGNCRHVRARISAACCRDIGKNMKPAVISLQFGKQRIEMDWLSFLLHLFRSEVYQAQDNCPERCSQPSAFIILLFFQMSRGFCKLPFCDLQASSEALCMQFETMGVYKS